MKSLGPLYVDTVTYPIKRFSFVTEIGWSQETDEPFRAGKCFVIKLPFIKTGVAIGIWRKKLNEQDALLNAIQARVITLEEAGVSDF